MSENVNTNRPTIRRPKVVDTLASEGFATLVNVGEGETVIVAGRTLTPGQHVVAVGKVGNTAEMTAFGFKAVSIGGKLRTPLFQHYTKTGGMEADAPLNVTLTGYLVPVGPEKAVIDGRRASAGAERAAKEKAWIAACAEAVAKGQPMPEKPKADRKGRTASGPVVEPAWEPIDAK